MTKMVQKEWAHALGGHGEAEPAGAIRVKRGPATRVIRADEAGPLRHNGLAELGLLKLVMNHQKAVADGK